MCTDAGKVQVDDVHDKPQLCGRSVDSPYEFFLAGPKELKEIVREYIPQEDSRQFEEIVTWGNHAVSIQIADNKTLNQQWKCQMKIPTR
jgi:hypothetical protein